MLVCHAAGVVKFDKKQVRTFAFDAQCGSECCYPHLLTAAHSEVLLQLVSTV